MNRSVSTLFLLCDKSSPQLQRIILFTIPLSIMDRETATSTELERITVTNDNTPINHIMVGIGKSGWYCQYDRLKEESRNPNFKVHLDREFSSGNVRVDKSFKFLEQTMGRRTLLIQNDTSQRHGIARLGYIVPE